jgi:large subunit ribosomal protein L29
MAKKQVQDLTDSELLDSLGDAKKDLFKVRFQEATGQLTNTALLKEKKKEIARLLTEVRSREITAAEALADMSGES